MRLTRWRQAARPRPAARAPRPAGGPLQLEPLEPRVTPAGVVAVLPLPGTPAVVTVFDAATNQQKFTLDPYPGFTGGVYGAVGDVDGDGTADVITGPGAGAGPVVNVYSGVDGTLFRAFTVGDESSRAGASVAAADFDADGVAEVVVGAVRNGQPLVQVLRFSDGAVLHEYAPFGGGGVSVAAADVNGDGVPDTVVGAGPGGGPRVTVFDGRTDEALMNLFAFDETFTGGVQVAAGDLNGDGRADVVAAAGVSGGPRVQAFSGPDGAVLVNFFAYGDQLRAGVRAVVFDADGGGSLDLVTANGPGQPADLKGFDPRTLAALPTPLFGGLPAGTPYDTAAPAVTLTTTAADPTRENPIRFTATFTEAVSGFAASDLTVTNGAASNLVRVDGRTYTFDVTPAGPGTVTVTVPAGTAGDAAGNENAASAPVSRRFALGVTVNPLTTNDNTPTLTGTAEAGSTVSVTVGGQSFPATLNGTAWTATVPSPLLDGTYTAIATANGPGGTATGSNTLVVDATAPTPTVSSTAPEPTTTSPIPFTVTLNEDVTGFVAGDLTVTNGAASGFTQETPRRYTFNVTPTGPAVTVSVAAGVTADAAGNGNAPSNSVTRTFNGGTGTITVTANPLTTNDTTPSLSGTVSDPTATVRVTAGGQQVTAAVSGTDWTATIPNPLAQGVYDIQVQATAGARSGSTTRTAGLVIDTTAPNPTLSTPSASPTGAATIPFTVNFGEVVSGFELSDITVANGAASNLAPGAAVGSFTFSVSPAADGTVTVSLAAAVARDAAGNGNAPSNQVSVTSDRTDPAAPGIGGLDPATDTGSSSTDGVTSDTTPTIAGAGETGSTVELFADGGSGAVSVGTATVVGGAWAITPASALANGTYVVRAVATDAAGNTSPTSDPFTLVVDAAGPTAAVDPTATSAVTGVADGTGSALATVRVSIFDPVSNMYWNQATGTFNSSTELLFPATLTAGTGNAASWSLAYTGPAGTFNVRAVATDAAGNETTASASVVFATT